MDEHCRDDHPTKTKNRQHKDLENLFNRLQRSSEQVIQCPNCKQFFAPNVLEKNWIRDWKPIEFNPTRQSLSSRKWKGQTRPETTQSQGKSHTPKSRNAKSRLRSGHLESGQLIPQFDEEKLPSPSAESRVLSLLSPESEALVQRIKLLMSQWQQSILSKFDREPNSANSPVKSKSLKEYLAKQGFGTWSQQDRFGNVIKSTFVDHKPHGLVIEDNGSTTEVYYSIMGKRNGPYLCKSAGGLVSYGCYCEDQRFGLWGFVHPDESFEQFDHGYEVLQSKID